MFTVANYRYIDNTKSHYTHYTYVVFTVVSYIAKSIIGGSYVLHISDATI